MTTTPHRAPRFWLWWVVAHVAAGAIGVTLLRVALGVGDWAVFGLVFGATQSLLVRCSVRLAAWWVVASALGGGVGVLLNQALNQTGLVGGSMAGYAMSGAIYGAGLGAAQWLLLWRRAAGAGAWWLVANTLSGGGGVVLAVLVNRAWFAVLGEGGDGVAAWAVFGLVYGLGTGVALSRLKLIAVMQAMGLEREGYS